MSEPKKVCVRKSKNFIFFFLIYHVFVTIPFVVSAAEESGVPAFSIASPENEAWVKNLTRMKDIDPDSMVNTHLMTAKALNDENFVNIAHDDLENPKEIEDVFSAIGKPQADFPLVELFFSFLLTWGIGLTPPFLIRYVFWKQQLKKWPAIGCCTLFWFVNLVIFTALGSESKTHAALFLIAVVSYYIVTTKDKQNSNSGYGLERSKNILRSFGLALKKPWVSKGLFSLFSVFLFSLATDESFGIFETFEDGGIIAFCLLIVPPYLIASWAIPVDFKSAKTKQAIFLSFACLLLTAFALSENQSNFLAKALIANIGILLLWIWVFLFRAMPITKDNT
jgi:hypothetical protein